MIAACLWVLAVTVFASSWLLSRWILHRREKALRVRGAPLIMPRAM